jgi:hypothetical protein
MKTLAAVLWEAEGEVARIKDEVGDLLDEIFGSEGWDDFRTDPYDSSIEIFKVNPECVLGDAQLTRLREAGFARVWTHTHATETRQPGERAYSLSKSGEEP